MYTAYVLSDESREELKQKFTPTYSKFIGHHITVVFGVPDDTDIPEEASIRVVGKIDSNDGIEALVVSVNGEMKRPDGNIYHITWSLEPDVYSPKDSNTLLQNNYFKYKITLPITIQTEPEILQ